MNAISMLKEKQESILKVDSEILYAKHKKTMLSELIPGFEGDHRDVFVRTVSYDVLFGSNQDFSKLIIIPTNVFIMLVEYYKDYGVLFVTDPIFDQVVGIIIMEDKYYRMEELITNYKSSISFKTTECLVDNIHRLYLCSHLKSHSLVSVDLSKNLSVTVSDNFVINSIIPSIKDIIYTPRFQLQELPMFEHGCSREKGDYIGIYDFFNNKFELDVLPNSIILTKDRSQDVYGVFVAKSDVSTLYHYYNKCNLDYLSRCPGTYSLMLVDSYIKGEEYVGLISLKF